MTELMSRYPDPDKRFTIEQCLASKLFEETCDTDIIVKIIQTKTIKLSDTTSKMKKIMEEANFSPKKINVALDIYDRYVNGSTETLPSPKENFYSILSAIVITDKLFCATRENYRSFYDGLLKKLKTSLDEKINYEIAGRKEYEIFNELKKDFFNIIHSSINTS